MCHEALRDYKQAEEYYLKTIKKNSRYGPAYEKLLKLYLASNTSTDGLYKYAEARKLLQNAVTLNIVNGNDDLLKIKTDTNNLHIFQ